MQPTGCMECSQPAAWSAAHRLHGVQPTSCMECSQPAAWSTANRLHGVQPTGCMECSQLAAWMMNQSLLMASCVKAFPGKSANSGLTPHRSAHLDSGVIGYHHCNTSHSGSASASPYMRSTPLALSCMHIIEHLYPCPNPTHD